MQLSKMTRQRILPNARVVFSRFSVPLTLSFLAGLVALADNHNLLRDYIANRALIIFVLSALLFLALNMMAESLSWAAKKRAYAVVILIFVVLVLGYCLASIKELFLYVSFFSLGAILLLMVSPFITQKSSNNDLSYFNYNFWIGVCFSILAMLILCLGITASMASVAYLFSIKIPSRLYADIWILGACLFAPLYAFSEIPTRFQFNSDELGYHKGVVTIASYILTPLMFMYFVILYVYGLKILIQWDLPQGNLAYMITAFGTIGIMTYILATPLYQTGRRMLDLFYSHFFTILLAPILLLIIGISVRVNAYGITEKRYAVVIATIWLSITALYFVLHRSPQIKVPIIVLSALCFLSAIGPWNAVNLSTCSQLSRLESLLIEQGILVNDRIVAAREELPFEKAKSISSIVQYFTRNRRVDALRPWFAEHSSAYINAAKGRFSDPKEIMKDMGLEFVPSWRKQQGEVSFNFQRYDSSFRASSRDDYLALNVSDYNRVVQFELANDIKQGKWSKTIPDSIGEFIFDLDRGVMRIRHAKKKHHNGKNFIDHANPTTVAIFDINAAIKTLRKNNISRYVPEGQLSLMTLDANDGQAARIYINNLSGGVKGEEIYIYQLRFLALF